MPLMPHTAIPLAGAARYGGASRCPGAGAGPTLDSCPVMPPGQSANQRR